MKPRNKKLNDDLLSRKSGPHEDRAGLRKAKRARQEKEFKRLIKESEETGYY